MAGEEEALLALKERCLEGETEEEHATHAAELEAAYKAFQERKGDVSESNPAPEGETPLEAHLTVESTLEPS
jgi:hypothetical protein